jgi:hypothetical protein
MQAKQQRQLSATSGRRARTVNVPKLDDAHQAGTKARAARRQAARARELATDSLASRSAPPSAR